MDITIRGAIQLLTDYNRQVKSQLTRRDIIANEFLLFRARSKARQHRDVWYEPNGPDERATHNHGTITLTTAVNAMVQGIFLDKQ